MRILPVAAALTLLLMPAAQAQDATSGLALTLGTVTPNPIPFDGNATVPVTVTIGCVALLQNLAAPATVANAVVGNATPPSWLVVTPATVPLDTAGCAPPNVGGFVTGTGTLGIKVKPDAPAVVVHHPLFTATLGNLSASQNADFNVSYRPEHTITPSIQFPYTMQGRHLNFTVTVTMGANARSMVMFESVRASPGAFSGLTSDYYQPGETKVFNVTYTAPDTRWTQANITFFAYSHYLLEGSALAGGSELERNETWLIKNGNEDGGDGTEPSPLPLAPMVLALVAAVLLARRKR